MPFHYIAVVAEKADALTANTPKLVMLGKFRNHYYRDNLDIANLGIDVVQLNRLFVIARGGVRSDKLRRNRVNPPR